MLNTTGVFKLISVKANGTAKNGRKYVHILAVDFFNQPTEEERNQGVKCQFFMLKAFGDKAEFLLKNFNDANGTRRAFIAGDIQLDTYTSKQKVSKTISFNGQKGKCTFDIDVAKKSVGIIVNDIRFLDKPNAKANTTEFTPATDEEEVVEFQVEAEQKGPAGEHTNLVDDTPDPNYDDMAGADGNLEE